MKYAPSSIPMGATRILNQLILLNSDLIIIPADLCVVELEEALKTDGVCSQAAQADGIDIPTGFLPSRTPVDDRKLATAERERIEESFSEAFRCSTSVSRSRNCRTSRSPPCWGPLNLYHARLKADPTIRFRSGGTSPVALGHAEAFTDEILRNVRTPELA